MPSPATPPAFDPARTAFFFDFDGTLVDIAEDPQAVELRPEVRDHLDAIHRATGGATAVISGRPIHELDTFLSPLRLAVAGVHGLERRSADGIVTSVEVDDDLIREIARPIEAFARENEGLIAERKSGSVALHYRQRPDLEEACRALAAALQDRDSRLRLLHGKMVVELKAGGRTKGDAIADFMAELPFRGRVPVFAGDDVTDEDGFRMLARWNGISIKVGEGATAATCRVANPAAFRDWLQAVAGSI